MSSVFGLDSSLRPLIWSGGGLVCELVGNADLHFESDPF